MPEAALYNCDGEKIEQISLSDQLFDAAPNEALVHQALVRLGRVRHVGSPRTKGRSEINLTKAKWYRQKGTGHARHGARSVPGFVGGAKAHGPRSRAGSARLPRRMRRQAMSVAISDKRRHGRLTVLDRFDMDGYSTKRFAEILDNLEAYGRILILIGQRENRDERIFRSGRNITGVKIRVAPHVSLSEALAADRIIMTREGLQALEEVWLS
jgi:large subunit ribosomal protein L4